MEILSRILRGIHQQSQVSYHPKCGKLGLNHLIFVDDLMLFVKGDTPSVQAITSSLDSFALLSGLHANLEKPNIYMAGIRDNIKQEILTVTVYTEGLFPFRYLGVPLNAGKLNKTMFTDLIAKVQKVLNHWSTYKLSYAGKEKNTHSESWRSILLVRDELLNMGGNGPAAERLLSGCVKKGCIQLSLLYDKFRRKGNPISWGATVWHRAVLPKHSVFLMLVMQQKLATIDKLNHRGISLVNRCVLCKADNETHKHLFFQCIFSTAIWHQVLHWLRMQHRTSKLSKEVHWIAGKKVRKHWKAQWFSSCLGATVYSLWEERNLKIFQGLEHDIDYVVKRIQYFVSIRLLSVNSPSKEGEIIGSLNA
ncbi:uncharacterized protein LOC141630942 [Silene latifolia]|uniref:uncharacterized protein LOC141630942 n=1 Tax=Silene latifolia TaxID=37657 RepID=UPI003D783126